jgi:teichuronic acid exporter
MPIEPRANSLTHRAAGATWWSTLEIASRYGVQFLLVIVLARLLSPADFGLIAMLLVFTSIGALLVDAGFATALVQRQQTTPDDETTVFAFAACSGAIAGLAIWLAAPLIAGFYQEPRLVPLTHAIAWVLPLGGLAAVPDALLTKRLQFERRARAQLLASGISGLIAIMLALRGFGVWSIAWQVVAEMLVRTTGLWFFAHWKPTGRLSLASFKGLFGFGGYMLLTRLLDTLYTRAQALLLGRLFDASTLGYYTLAQNAQQAPANFIGTVLSRVGLPVFAELADQPARLRGAFRMSLRMSLFVFLPCMIGLALAAGPIVAFVYGPHWLTAAPVLSLLALASAFWPLHVLNLAALTSQGRSDLLLRLEIMKKVVSFTLIILVSPLGPVAVAAAVLASSLYGAVINTHYSKRMLDYGLAAQLLDQRLTIYLCAISAGVGWSILHWTLPSLLHTVIAIVAATVVYIGGAFLFRNDALFELVNVGRSLWGSWNAGKVRH